MLNRVGQVIGNFRLDRLLGRGGFAEVYLGQHVQIDSYQVAIKVLATQLEDKEIIQFRDEARTLIELDHPSIVRVTDFGIVDHTPYIIMTYAPNGSLRSRHPKGTHLPLQTVVSYVKPIASALQYAYDKKRLIHRDIKPDNILLGKNQEILLSDFGLATVARHTSTQSAQEIAGTAIYMAPEQFRGKPRAASDQYSLGIMTYEWICGVPPYNKGNFIQLAFQHTSEDNPPPSLSSFIPTILPAVEQVVLKALAKDPSARFTSVQEFAQALEDAYQRRQFSSSLRSSMPPPAMPPVTKSEVRDNSALKTPQSLQAPLPPDVPSSKRSTRDTDSQSSRSASTPPPQPYNSSQPYQQPYVSHTQLPYPQPYGSVQPYPQPYNSSQPYPQPYGSSQPYQQIYIPQQSYGAYTSPYASNAKPNYLPLIHGRAIGRDTIIIGAYALPLLLSTFPLIFASPKTLNPGSSNYQSFLIYIFLWFLVILPSGALLGGATLGKWRGALALLLFIIPAYVLATTVYPTEFPRSVYALGFLGLPVASFVAGSLYERRLTRGCLGSIGAMLLGSAIFAIGVMITTLNQSSNFIAGIIGEIFPGLLLAVVWAFFACLLEQLIQVIVAAVKRGRMAA